MAKIKTTAFLDAISGKVNGTVFSRNRSGAYVRSKGVIKFKAGSELADSVNLSGPTVQTGSAQGAQISILSTLSKKWGGVLTGDQRIAFNNAVDSWQRTDVFGDLKTPTGFNLFTRLNATQLSLLQHVSGLMVPVPPINTPPLALIPLIGVVDAVFSITMGDATASPDPIVPNMILFGGNPNGVMGLSEQMGFLIEMTRPMSAGKSKVFDSDFRQVRVDASTNRTTGAFGTGYALSADNSGVGSVTPLVEDYIAKFGLDFDENSNPSLVGSKIFVRITPVSLIQGTKGQPQLFSCLVEGAN